MRRHARANRDDAGDSRYSLGSNPATACRCLFSTQTTEYRREEEKTEELGSPSQTLNEGNEPDRRTTGMSHHFTTRYAFITRLAIAAA